MKSLIVLVILVWFNCAIALPRTDLLPFADSDVDEDATLTVPQIITKYGYPVEVHNVTTSDGYILTMHRIPHGKKMTAPSKKVVLLQHGLLCSSADWIFTGEKNAFGYILADNGYDVWMGNFRGNKESRKHTHLDPDKNATFWHFSWHEMGYYDLPAMIDYVLENTGEKSLFHIGHSQGTTTFYVMNSMRPEYNAKIKSHFSLAPVVFMNHLVSPLLRILSFWDAPLIKLLEIIGVNEFLPSTEFISQVGRRLCGDHEPTQVLCSNVLFALCGFSPKEMNATLLPILLGHTPAGSSTRQLLHYAQEVESGKFRRYDFGSNENKKIYGNHTPPDYNLKLVTAPVYLVYSHNDWMAADIDVIRLYQQLPNVKGRFVVEDKEFNHLDYMYAIHAPEYVYNRVLSLMAMIK